MKSIITSILLVCIIIIPEAYARQFRVGQIPNGGVFKCANCHVSPSGGGSLNKFGNTVQSKFINGNGNVAWGPELAAIDSDNDGFPNGVELGDPNGAWKIGDPPPGITADVSKPWDENSVPPAMVVETTELINRIFTYPNPVVNSISISVNLDAPAPISFKIYNILGELTFSSAELFLNEGENVVSWNTVGSDGFPVLAGEYIISIKAGSYAASRKIVVAR